MYQETCLLFIFHAANMMGYIAIISIWYYLHDLLIDPPANSFTALESSLIKVDSVIHLKCIVAQIILCPCFKALQSFTAEVKTKPLDSI